LFTQHMNCVYVCVCSCTMHVALRPLLQFTCFYSNSIFFLFSNQHWIWWEWPSLHVPWRRTSRSDLQFPSFATACHYLSDPKLYARLIEITEAANVHLAKGVHPTTLFGSQVDCDKFHEVMSCFYLAAQCTRGDVSVFAESVQYMGGVHPPTVAVAQAFIAANLTRV
jgi:uncharacterized protein (DUF1810 family)